MVGLMMVLAWSLGTVFITGPASADVTPSVEVTSATSVDRGVAVDVHLTITCAVGSRPTIYLTVAQRVGSEVTQAQAYGFTGFTCLGVPAPVTVRAAVLSGSPALKTKDALIQGAMQNPDLSSVSINETVKITKK
jgi:hypothetical protein